MSMEENFKDASLHPPVHDHRPQDEACAPRSWAMIDVRAYIADRRNATTAYGRMRNGGVIQVTFCLAPPPVASYFCIWCPEATHLNKIGTEPRIRAAEADLVVLCVALGSGFDCDNPKCQDFFVYHAGGGEKRPSLRLIKLDDPYCLFSNTGILRHCNDSDPEDDQYHIVAIRHSKLSWQFNLHIFDSKTDIWSSRRISVEGRDHQHSQFRHSTRKVIMLGEGDMMAFVDPWRGLLVCNVLDSEATLHYIAFPRPLKDNKKILVNPVVARDIVVAQGFMKVIDCFYCCAKSAWKASVWRRVATSLENNWDRDHMFLIRDSLVDTNMSHFELFPKLQADGDNSPQKTLEALHIAHPILSLSDDHSVYFMAKVDPWDNRAWVLAVDLKNRRIQDVGVINDLRSHDVSLVFIHSRISKYFKTAPGIKGDSKRPGKFLRGRPFKKQAGAPVVDDIMQNDAVSSMGQQELMDLD